MIAKFVISGDRYRAALADRLNLMYCNEDDVTPDIIASVAWEELEKLLEPKKEVEG